MRRNKRRFSLAKDMLLNERGYWEESSAPLSSLSASLCSAPLFVSRYVRLVNCLAPPRSGIPGNHPVRPALKPPLLMTSYKPYSVVLMYSNPDLPVIGSPFYCESNALDHSTIEWGTSVDVTEMEKGGRRECFQNNHQEQTALPINMSVVPLMFRDWWDDFDRPTRLMDQHFAMGLRRDDLLSSLNPLLPLRSSGYLRPWRHLNRQDSGGVSSITTEKDKFQVILDVQQFSPSEITVKTVGNEVIVEAKHEEKQDEHGYVSRHFLRRYLLPTDIEVKDVVSSLSSDGVLTVTAPKKVSVLIYLK
uniref:SHSP domain-containing protein n=1 Tax=Timema monikensis TaxID=170555 RepID=A0A7R9E1Z5_9NEOP|nr:unnamed protein product [Timema monikensis]